VIRRELQYVAGGDIMVAVGIVHNPVIDIAGRECSPPSCVGARAVMAID